METKRILKFAGLGIILVILAIFVSMGFIIYDVMSYTATGSEILNPAGNPVGKALVVYDPGISGTAKNAASAIAGDLQTKGYTVNLAGIRSSVAANTTGYNVIVVGGPIYAGHPASSVQSYLLVMNPPKDAKIGVFTTGSVDEKSNDTAFIREEIAINNTSVFMIDDVMKFVAGDNINQKVAAFVNGILGQL